MVYVPLLFQSLARGRSLSSRSKISSYIAIASSVGLTLLSRQFDRLRYQESIVLSRSSVNYRSRNGDGVRPLPRLTLCAYPFGSGKAIEAVESIAQSQVRSQSRVYAGDSDFAGRCNSDTDTTKGQWDTINRIDPYIPYSRCC